MNLKKPLKNKKIIVAVDIALNKTGVAIMDFSKYVYSTFLISNTISRPYYEKLDNIYDTFFSEFFNVRHEEPKSVILVLEDRLRAGFSGAALASIEGSRVSSYHAFRQAFMGSQTETGVVFYDPGSVKKHFTGVKTSKKDIVFKSVQEKNPFIKKYKQEDILDAIYLALYHIALEK